MTIDGVFCGGIIELDNPVHSTLEESYPIKWLPNPNQKLIPSRFQSLKRSQNIRESESELGEEAGGDQLDDDILQRMRVGRSMGAKII